MDVLRTRTRKACQFPREHSPVNRYAAPQDVEGIPYPLSLPSDRRILGPESQRKIIRTNLSASPHASAEYVFIQNPSIFRKEPIGYDYKREFQYFRKRVLVLTKRVLVLSIGSLPGWGIGFDQKQANNLSIFETFANR